MATVLMGVAFIGHLGAFAVNSPPTGLSASELGSLLRDPKVKISATSTTVVGTGPAVTVVAEESDKASDQDLKIDAIFLSKTLIEGAPSQVQAVKVLFSQSGKEGRYINVSQNEIRDYGSGKLSAVQLLASLRFTEVEPDDAPDIKPGLQYERRLLLWNRIEKLRTGGTGVKAFQSIFQDLETAVSGGDTKQIKQKIEYLENKLSEQEENLKLIRKAARGHGVPARASASSSSSSSSSSGPYSGNSGMSGRLNSDQDYLKNVFDTQGDSLISRVNQMDPPAAAILRDKQRSIREAFKMGRINEAFQNMSFLRGCIKTHLKIDPFDLGQRNNSTVGSQPPQQQTRTWRQNSEPKPPERFGKDGPERPRGPEGPHGLGPDGR